MFNLNIFCLKCFSMLVANITFIDSKPGFLICCAHPKSCHFMRLLDHPGATS